MKYVVNVDKRITLTKPEECCNFPVFLKFVGDFNEENCSKFRQNLIQAENEALSAEQSVLPIVIDSYGGEVYELLACLDAIKAIDSSLKVATIVEGKAMSCGAVLLTAGHEGYRFATPNSTIMIHEVSSMNWGKNEEIKASAKETSRLNDLIMEIMSENCGQTKKYFEKQISNQRHADWFLNSKEALSHNIVNHIGCPTFDIKVKMDVQFGLINSTYNTISKSNKKKD